jgi:hypothetical protein
MGPYMLLRKMQQQIPTFFMMRTMKTTMDGRGVTAKKV